MLILSMLSVIDAMNASKGFTRPMREGEKLLQSGMVVSVGNKSRENDVVIVQSLVLHTSGIGSKAPAVVELWVDVSKEYGERVVKDNEEEFRKQCDCPAGNSQKCKHIVTVMLCLASIEEEGLEDISCTDVKQQWGTLKKTTLKEFEAKPISELCHVKGQKDVFVNGMPEVTKEMEKKWRQKLMNSVPQSEYSLFTSCVRQGQGVAYCEKYAAGQSAEKTLLLKKLLTFRSWRVLGKIRQLTLTKLATLEPELRDFYESHVATTLEDSLKIISAEQGTAAWHRDRKFRLTASKARAQYTYYLNKKADWDAQYKDVFHSTFHGNENTIRGLADEAPYREKYEERFSCTILESGLLVRPELPWLAASLDGTMLDNKNNFSRNIEIKSFKEGTRLTSNELIEMNVIPTLDANGNMKKNTHHYTQMQLGMLVSGISECDYLMWSGVDLDFMYKRIDFDEVHVLLLCSQLINVFCEKFLPRMMAEYSENVCV